jgi:hypothetical protein
MPQYLIIALDGTDAEASERRMNVRPAHFDGAILDDNGKMTGSMMVV